MSDRGDFFFCTKHHRVERRGDSCPGRDLLGPYATEDEASRALEKVEALRPDPVAPAIRLAGDRCQG